MAATHADWKAGKGGKVLPPTSSPVLMALFLRYDLAVDPPEVGLSPIIRSNTRSKVLRIWGKYNDQMNVVAVRMRLGKAGAGAAQGPAAYKTSVDRRVDEDAVVDGALESVGFHSSPIARRLAGVFEGARLSEDIRTILVKYVKGLKVFTLASSTNSKAQSAGFKIAFLRQRELLRLQAGTEWAGCQAVTDVFNEVDCGEPWDGWSMRKRVLRSGAVICTALYAEFAAALASDDHARWELTLPNVVPYGEDGGGGCGEKGAGVVYYCAGAILVAMKNKGRRLAVGGCGDLSNAYISITAENSFVPPIQPDAVTMLIKESGLPIRLALDRRGQSSQFPKQPFYRLVWNIEQCYAALLSERNVMIHGGAIVRDVHELIKQSRNLRAQFKLVALATRKQHDESETTKLAFSSVEEHAWSFVLEYYFRMRGKEMCGRLLTKIRASSQALSIRHKVAAKASVRSVGVTKSRASAKRIAVEAVPEEGEEGEEGGFDDESGGIISAVDLADVIDTDAATVEEIMCAMEMD
jgi:hypothetical protein